MAADTWTLATAKAHFSELVERARSRGPQTVTKNGKVAVVVVDAQEWERKTHRADTLAEFFASSPLRGSGLTAERRSGTGREVDL